MPRREAAIVSTLLLFTYGYFYQAGGWNQNTRFDLVRAIVEKHTLRIDSYHTNTGDKARVGEHVYCDKAPGASLFAVPAVALLHGVGVTDAVAMSYVATLASAALPTIVAALCLLWLSRRLLACPGRMSMLVFAVGTPMFAYATLFWGHALAAGCLVAGFSAAVALWNEARDRDLLLGACVGLCCGWAVVTEYPAAPPAVLIAGLALWHARRWRVALGLGAGALFCLGVLLLYNQAAFGSAFHLGYANVQGFEGMRRGVFGVTRPRLDVLVAILFGSSRGLFRFAPALILAPVGFWLLRRNAATLCACGIAIYYVMLNASYGYWNGGWSYGPRHLAPAIPFLSLGLAAVWQRGPKPWRLAIAAVSAFGVVTAIVAVATTAQPPEAWGGDPMAKLWSAFLQGDLSVNHQSFLEASADPSRLLGGALVHDAWNLGEKVGLRGLWSLMPLGLAWIAGVTFLLADRKR